MKPKGLILFDIDGVIRDCSKSYMLATKKTVYSFCGWEPSFLDIDNLKNEGIWNNDWDLSLELIKRFTNENNLSTITPLREEIIKCFGNLYFGCCPDEDYSKWSGFIRNEKILVNKDLFQDLTNNHILWGFVSGAEIPSAKYVLENKLNLKNPPLVAMGDAPDKPNPEGFIYLAQKLLTHKLGVKSPPVAYVGDTIADIKTVINARQLIPEQVFISIGIAPPHLHPIKYYKERIKYESNLEKSGADLIIKSINDIKKLSSSLFLL